MCFCFVFSFLFFFFFLNSFIHCFVLNLVFFNLINDNVTYRNKPLKYGCTYDCHVDRYFNWIVWWVDDMDNMNDRDNMGIKETCIVYTLAGDLGTTNGMCCTVTHYFICHIKQRCRFTTLSRYFCFCFCFCICCIR